MSALPTMMPVHYLNSLGELLAQQGAEPRDWVARAGLSMADLAQSQQRIALDKWQALLKCANQSAGDQPLSILLGKRLNIQHHGALGLALVNSKTLAQALDILVRFLVTRNPLLSLKVTKSDPYVHLVFHWQGDDPEVAQWVLEILLVCLCRGLRQIMPDQPLLHACSLAYSAPEYAGLMRTACGTDIHFGAKHSAVTLNARFLQRPLFGADEHDLQQALLLCEQESAQSARYSGYSQQVVNQLQQLGVPFVSLQTLADSLSVTPRTLHRRLKAEGSSYRQVVAEAQQQLARRALSQSGMSVEALASLLGYQDTANFRRAFKRWFGMTPSEMRQGKRTQ